MMSFNFRTVMAIAVFIGSVLSQTAHALDVSEQVEVKGLTLVKQTRINRTVFEYTYQINIFNSGSPLAGVVASIASSSAKMQIVDATVNLGDLPGYAQGLSKDTFMIRLDRSVAFDASALTWQVNGEQTQDACKSTPSITTPTPTIHQTLPASAPTGSTILINGTGFTTCSHVFLGGKEIFLPKVISDRQLQIFVPFDVNSQNQLIPLATDSYPIKVDGSSPYDFTVTDLPENPNPPGQLLAELIDATFQSLSESLPEFQAILPQLLDENTDHPATQKLLQNLNASVSEINAKGSSDIATQLSALDSQSLDTLERAIFNNTPPDSGTSSAPAMSKAITTTNSIVTTNSYTCSRTSGDEWLRCREAFAYTSQFLSNTTKVLGYCAKLTALTGGATALACAKIGLIVGLVSTAAETSLAYKLGSVRKLEFQVANVPNGDITSDGTSLNLRVNNLDNNYDHPTSNAKIALGAKLGISNQVNMALILKTFMDVVLHAVDVDLGQAGEWLRDYALDWKNDQINKPTDYVLVTPAVLKHILTYEFYDRTSIPSFSKPLCNIHDSDGYYAMQTSPKGSGALDWVFAVPDQGGLTFTSLPIGDCEIKIADQFRMSSEDDISSEINVFVKRYAKLTVNVTGDGYVTYSRPTYSGRNKCGSGTSPCTEYFDVPIGTPITLTAHNSDGSNATNSTWNGRGMSTGSCSGFTNTCLINLDVKNSPPPNILVAFVDVNNFIVGTWNAYQGDGGDNWKTSVPIPSNGDGLKEFTLVFKSDGTGSIHDLWTFSGESYDSYSGLPGITYQVNYDPATAEGTLSIAFTGYSGFAWSFKTLGNLSNIEVNANGSGLRFSR